MREHQITITLQAEQFQEIQRLARTAGARSVGTFAREKLLAALGLTMGSKNLKATRVQDLNSVTGELTRLHRELQIFIAESLSAKDYGYIVNGQDSTPEQSTTDSGEPTSDSSSANFPGNNAGALQEYSHSAREAEDLAERAFIISPRLGAIEEVSDEPMNFSDPLDELLGEFDEIETPVVASNLLNALEEEQSAIEEKADSGQEDRTNNADIANDVSGEIPHSVFDDELAAFQKKQSQTASTAPEEAPPQTQNATTSAETDAANAVEQGAQESNNNDEDVNLVASAGIQEEGSDIDFQNRPPLSGGPPPRKRRT